MAMHVVDYKESLKNSDMLKHCICVEIDNEIYKFKISFNHMDVVNSIEDYINLINVHNFDVTSEDDILKRGMLKKFFPYLGKFRLEGNIKSTNNYFVPIDSEVLSILFSIYKSDILTQEDFVNIYNLHNSLFSINDSIINVFIKQFLSKMKITMLNKYSFEELNKSIECIENVSTDIKLSDTYLSLKNLLLVAKDNKEKINILGFNDKFVEATKDQEKQNKLYYKA